MQQEATLIFRAIDDKFMEFVVFAIESATQKTGIPATVLYNRLEILHQFDNPEDTPPVFPEIFLLHDRTHGPSSHRLIH